MLSILDRDPQKHKLWTEPYYECSISMEVINYIYEHRRRTDALVLELNPERDLETLASDVKEIGYPA
jgi:hypothetical protein